jgi:1,4-dihydroxy-2-naphthoate octaprenyltransferase
VSPISAWLKAVRPAYLPASLIPVTVGLAYAWGANHSFNLGYALVTLGGITFAHMSADLFNDYFDYAHGTDQLSKLRGLSGGSGVLVDGVLTPRKVLRGGFTLLGLALVCGLYLTLRVGLLVLLLMGLGAISIYAYTSLLQRVGLGELTLALERVATVLGTYYVQAHRVVIQPILLGVILGVLSIYMVYYAAFPDYDADKQTGKKTLVVILGYSEALEFAPTLLALSYILLILCIAAKLLPYTTLITLLVLPVGYQSIMNLRNVDDQKSIRKGLKQTALFTRLYGVLLALSLLLI